MAKQDKALKDKLATLGYPDFEVKPGEEDVPMLHVQGRHICGVDYALSMSDEQLQALIDETLEVV